MTQTEFAAIFGLNLNTLKNWEHGRRAPDASTKSYLYAISKRPELIGQALYSEKRGTAATFIHPQLQYSCGAAMTMVLK